MLGTGKTFTTTRLASILDLSVIVVAPVSVKPKWSMMQKEHGLRLESVISFCELRSSKFHVPKHGFLTRRDYTVQREDNNEEIAKVEFNATPKLQKLVDSGCLLVIDEIQNVKNLSNQFYATRELIRTFKTSERSRVLLISGSPFDKKEQVVHLFRCLDIMRSPKLLSFNPRTFDYVYQGFEEIVEYCRGLENGHNHRINTRHLYGDATRCVDIVYKLFQSVFRRHRVRAMPPMQSRCGIVKRNGYFQIMDEKDAALLLAGVNNLSKAVRFDEDTGGITFGADAAHVTVQIVQSMMMIETAKIQTFVRLARTKLLNEPDCKVCICVNYIATLTDLKRNLKEFGPLILQGSMSATYRGQVIEKFQSVSHNNENRLLLANAHVCSTGIDLDDKIGGHPRMDTVGPSTIFMVFGKYYDETRVLDALSRKALVMKQTLTEQSNAGVEFPGNFEAYYE
ncbi:hypothetical protein CEUSTIGMA_g10763.t1 [Chlamydomonas eustigma]|uniref:Helicase ATP-binding domain-containing protein n=1 Tax=Chlamydomonas eustigma TaxID=1157962 RepID=A0A250XJU4_9CHLO|nr:hypothetical protein CEUSTIGMA_g10763.t1 [Chlamydomonas eustigma]|eukprot:GAX83338.1 hypothetical protein CEUSTIGMA_g10763.t1 [Chlamydomonas eustigma]